jgi:serine/threonine protein kinase
VKVCPAEQHLHRLLAEELSLSERSTLESHVEECPQCQARLEQLTLDPVMRGKIIVEPGRQLAWLPLPDEDAAQTTLSSHDLTSSAIQRDPLALDGSGSFVPLPDAGDRSLTFPFLRPPQQPGEMGRLGAYGVLRLLAKGGMAFVFQAEDLALHRPVALKVMNPILSAQSESGRRLIREGQFLASIHHEHLVTVYQAGQDNGVVFLAMELLRGETLNDWVKRVNRPAVADVERLAREAPCGLEVIHAHGLIHRDIKPSNLWMEERGEGRGARGEVGQEEGSYPGRGLSSLAPRVKILDFGLARLIDDENRLTESGLILGTPGFMSPEQAAGEVLDPRSDLFSLGCVLYLLCTGREPFRGSNIMAMLSALATSAPPPVRAVNPSIPPHLATLVMHLLEKKPEDRPPNARWVLHYLDRAATGEVPTGAGESVAAGPVIQEEAPGRSRDRAARRGAGDRVGCRCVTALPPHAGAGRL